ncbi:MAG: response regulator [Deltaproteobacteria bacterium]|nr:response regulator [Deltaproteobacteria bacterium]
MFDSGGDVVFSSWPPSIELGDAPSDIVMLASLLGESESAKSEFLAFVKDMSSQSFKCDFVCSSAGTEGESHFRLSAVHTISGDATVMAVHISDVSDEYGAMQEMESLERQVSAGQMAAGVAHEFNNILTAMMGWTQLAFRAVQGNSSAEMAISTIDNNTRRARRIAGELLDISSPNKSVETQLMYVEDAVKDALKLLSWDLANQQINVVDEIFDTRPSMVNSTRLVQVFVNIIRNAMDAMDARGTLGVRVVQEGETVVVTITDTGHGISDEALEKAFLPFFTTKSRSDKTFGGSGLGMVVSKRIIEEFGGSIQLARGDSPEVGTVVTISLPTQEAVRESIVEENGRSSTFPPGVAVLVVDDEPDICEMIRMALNLRGAHVVSATSGEDALALCRQEMFNAAFLDFSMTGLSGHELKKAISDTQPALPIVFMSGVDIPNLDADMDFLKKPFDLHDIQVKLREILERSTVHSDALRAVDLRNS